MKRYVVLGLFVALGVVGVGCGGDSGGEDAPVGDVGVDNRGDTRAEADAVADASDGAEMDSAVDVSADTPSDTEMDSAADVAMVETRPFFLGFTYWPYDLTVEAIVDSAARIRAEGDIVTHHLMGGVPWQEALDGVEAYPANIEGEVCSRLQLTYPDDNITPDALGRCAAPDDPTRRPVVLAVDTLNTLRTGMAGYWGASESEPRDAHPPWGEYDFDAPQIADAYITFVLDMIDRFKPAIVNYGTEASDLLLNDADAFARYVIFAQRVYAAIKAAHPELVVMVSVALKTPGESEMQTIAQGFPALVEHCDALGVSVYPYAFFSHADKGDPARLPTAWFSQAEALAAGRPLAVTETGWIAEDLRIDAYGLDVRSSPAKQAAYVEALFEVCRDAGCLFINWFTVVDFDALWEAIGSVDLAALWRDTGLFDEALQVRPALELWRDALARPLDAP